MTEDDIFSNHAESTNRKRGDTSVMFSASSKYDSSPDVSHPLAPNHRATKSKLSSSISSTPSDQINTLKGTLQHGEEPKIGYHKRVESPVAEHGLGTEEDTSDEEQENEELSAGQKQTCKRTPCRVRAGIEEVGD
ncbi:hypothetical protein FA95DRAFT_1564270 [Auriscalpium vulgare]|uniref:Uncharacterized protein n=1 Tax=Auriscalpium vulgare TaxID=40419 RepID=A0ACB8RF30_9AGAM|nr:hypothetical protein FA95DRAFT_1564270 [Auriscalpium vulgare]